MSLSTSLFIRDFLLEQGETYPYQIYKALKARLKEEGYAKRKTSYQSIRNYFYWLKELGLIEVSRTAPGKKAILKDRSYYKIITSKADNLALWKNPREALYPTSYQEHH